MAGIGLARTTPTETLLGRVVVAVLDTIVIVVAVTFVAVAIVVAPAVV